MKNAVNILFITTIVLLLSMSKSFSQTLHIYGGQNNETYLGCINCNTLDANSIWNEYGTYGNSYNSQCIWNEYGTYGNEYGNYCPWNSYATDPPIIVDENGNFYGYLTVNDNKSNRANFVLALTLYQYYDLIRDNVSKWYSKIFQ